jgi:glycosidase
LPTPRSVNDSEIDRVIADARRRAALSDADLAAEGAKRPFRSPEDWRDLAMYFLVIDRFANPAKAPATRWNGQALHRQGGSFAGITAQLPYLRDLGIGALWITPPVRNSASSNLLTYHGYAAQDLLAVDERFASDGTRDTAEKELGAMVERAHELGIRVVLDVVLNHTGSVFSYNRGGNVFDSFEDQALLDGARGGGDLPGVAWKDGLGNPHPEWGDFLAEGQASGRDDAVYPVQFRDTFFFRRRGKKTTDDLGRYRQLGFVPGDFETMRQLVVEYEAADNDPARRPVGKYPVLTLLLRTFYYWVARYDFDGLRLDTVKYVDPKFIQRFGTAMTEFGYAIGKKNFFTFGEVADNNSNIASFVGRNGPAREQTPDGGLGINAALDFPLDNAIKSIATGLFDQRGAVSVLRDVFDERRSQQDELVATHGDASSFFVTFVDNHDRHQRVRHPQTSDAEARLCLALPYLLPGIPCLYYGDEQDLTGTTDDAGNPALNTFESVREALWGKFGAGVDFPRTGGTFQMLAALIRLRARSGPLKYGRYYFRQVSGDGQNFGWSMDKGGVFAFSRIHADEEVLVVCTPNPFQGWSGLVEIDPNLARDGANWRITFSTLRNEGAGRTRTISAVPLRRAIPVTLASNELVVLERA